MSSEEGGGTTGGNSTDGWSYGETPGIAGSSEGIGRESGWGAATVPNHGEVTGGTDADYTATNEGNNPWAGGSSY